VTAERPPRLPEVELATPLVVIADLHLDLGRAEGGEAFARWLEALRGARSLAILGDLFDVWVGPAQARLPGAARVLDALAGLTARGAQVLLVHGNRDFLLDASFERRTGARVLPDGFAAGLPGLGRALFVHGDTLCTLDVGYQRLRRVVRSGPVRWIAPRMPLALGSAVARRLRRASTQAVARKPSEEKSVQRGAADALARGAGAQLLVCGHAHEFRDERLAGGARWIVLDAWGGARDALVATGGGVRALAAAGLAGRDCGALPPA
jgi:UDP-2,3-diacylglucosamine hydrolase